MTFQEIRRELNIGRALHEVLDRCENNRQRNYATRYHNDQEAARRRLEALRVEWNGNMVQARRRPPIQYTTAPINEEVEDVIFG